MSYSKHLNEYQKSAVHGASPLQLVVMLYDGAIRFLELAKAGIERKDVFVQNTNFQKAQRIVTELMSCLDMERGGEISQNLFALYSFCYNNLIEANLMDDSNKADQVLRVLRELRDSWTELERRIRNGGEENIEPQALAA